MEAAVVGVVVAPRRPAQEQASGQLDSAVEIRNAQLSQPRPGVEGPDGADGADVEAEPSVELSVESAIPEADMKAAAGPCVHGAFDNRPSTSFLPESPCERLPEADKEKLLYPPSQLVCSITGDLYIDPVVTEDGHTYERAAIEEWFLAARSACRPLTSPKTNMKLGSDKLFPNMDKKATVIEWQEEAAASCCENAKKYPADAVWLLRKAMELTPGKTSLWLLLAEALETEREENWREQSLRCRIRHATKQDSIEGYEALLQWCEANGKLVDFQISIMRIAEQKFPSLRESFKLSLRRAGVAVQSYDEARRAARLGRSQCRQVSAPMDEMPDMKLYRCEFKVNRSSKELPTILCVNSEGVTAFNISVKGADPIICRYTFHQILSWTVSPKQFSFHVMKRERGQNVKTPYNFCTPEAREISMKLKSHVNVLLRERNKSKRPEAELLEEEQGLPLLTDLVVDEFYSADEELRNHVLALAGSAASHGGAEVVADAKVSDQSAAEPEPLIEDTGTAAIQGNVVRAAVVSVPAPRANTMATTAAPGASVLGVVAARVVSLPTAATVTALESSQSHTETETHTAVTAPPAQLPRPSIESTVTGSQVAVTELLKVFPNEPRSALQEALSQNGNDVERAAMWLLDKPVSTPSSQWSMGDVGSLPSTTWTPPGDGQDGVGEDSGEVDASEDIMRMSMAMMSAAMVAPANGPATTAEPSMLAPSPRPEGLDAARSSGSESTHGNDLIDQLAALEVPSDPPQRSKRPGILRRLRPEQQQPA